MAQTRCVVCDELYDSELERCPRCFESAEPDAAAAPADATVAAAPATAATAATAVPRSRRSRTKAGGVNEALLGWLGVSGILVVAALLRFWDLGRKSLWLDELFSVSVTSAGPVAAFKADMSDTNPPLYYLVQSIMSAVFGRSEAALRLMPALAGVATVLIVYLAAKKMFGWKVGLAAAALLALAPLGVQYSQEARMYSLLMLGCALELLAFAALVEKPNVTRALLLALALAVTALTHVYGYMAAALLIVPVLAMPRLRKRVGRMFTLATVGALVLFAPWALVVPRQIASVRAASAGGSWWMIAPGEVLSAFVKNVVQLGPSMQLIPALLFVGLAIVGAHPGKSDPGFEPTPDDPPCLLPSEAILTLVSIGLVPVFIGLAVSNILTPVADIRNELVALPVLCILVARGAMRLPRWWAVVALAAVLLFSAAALPAYYADHTKGFWHDASALVLQTDPKPVVVAEDYENALEMSTYADIYGKRQGLKLVWMSASLSSAEGTISAGNFDNTADTFPLRQFLASQNRIFVISRDSTSRVNDLLATMPDWHEAWSKRYPTAPIVRLWTRSAGATTAP